MASSRSGPQCSVSDQVEYFSEVIIVGGGPAGLAAALYLGRFRRQVTVFDSGDSRANLIAKSHNCPGFPGGISGRTLLKRLRRQALKFGARFIDAHVQGISRASDGFKVRSIAGLTMCRRIILATGIVDATPDIAGMSKLIAAGAIRLCPVCDGYEAIGLRVAVLGPESKALREALFLRDYTPHVVVLCTHSPGGMSPLRAEAMLKGIEIAYFAENPEPTKHGFNVAIAGNIRQIDVVYAALGSKVRSELATAVGAHQDGDGCVLVNKHQETSVDGVYAIGDMVSSLNQIAVGFGHAVLAATDIHNDLRT